MTTLLSVNDLHVYFDTPQGVVRANNGVTLEVEQGKSLGIMGESGCGKTVLFLAMLRLQQPGRIVRGTVRFDGQDIMHLSEREMGRVRGSGIALVPQNQATALNPAYRIKDQLVESVAVREYGGSLATVTRAHSSIERAAAAEISRTFRELGFADERILERLLQSYPHQLSGGMRQRVLIAMALLRKPRVLIADEPTTALDRATRLQSLAMLRALKGALSMMVISHDVEAIRAMCDRVAVMYAGRIVERGPVADVLVRPRHPYSRLLIAAQRRTRGEPLAMVTAETADLTADTDGCPYHRSCTEALPQCSVQAPTERAINGVTVACHLCESEDAGC